jgi:hypothetical protein
MATVHGVIAPPSPSPAAVAELEAKQREEMEQLKRR